MPKYFSVVYEIDDSRSDTVPFELMKTAQVNQTELIKGVKIHACGWGDYATQAEAFQAEIEGEGKDPLDVIANFINDEGMGPDDVNYRLKALGVMGE